MPDVTIADHGSVLLIRPMTEAARRWLDDKLVTEPWQWCDGGLAIDHRCAGVIVAELIAAGFRIAP